MGVNGKCGYILRDMLTFWKKGLGRWELKYFMAFFFHLLYEVRKRVILSG